MKVKQLINRLQKMNQNDEVLLTDADNGEWGEQIQVIDVRRVIDNEARNGQRRVVVITTKEYGYDCFEFINEV